MTKAMIAPHCSGGEVWKACSASGRGRTDSPRVTIVGHNSCPQENRKVGMATLAKTALASGATTWTNVLIEPAPSTRAASSSSFGMFRKNV